MSTPSRPHALTIDIEFALSLAGDLFRGAQLGPPPPPPPRSGDPALAGFEQALTRAMSVLGDAATALARRATELAEDSRRATEAVLVEDEATAARLRGEVQGTGL